MRAVWLLLFAAACIGGWLYLHPETLDQARPWLPESATGSSELYQWKNRQGEWQVTDTPPPAGTAFEKKTYRSDANVLPVPPGITQEP